ncbi:MAG: hypothetical protein WAN35_12015 [Terracidiphilus sp.]|jgi:hypothetical protein
MDERIYLYPYAGPGGRNYVKQLGTLQDIEKLHITFEENLVLHFYCDDADDSGKTDDLIFEGTAHFDLDRRSWYILIDEDSYRHTSMAGVPSPIV